jgi:hypothetical protein
VDWVDDAEVFCGGFALGFYYVVLVELFCLNDLALKGGV